MSLPYAILKPMFFDGMRHRSKPYDLPSHWQIVDGVFTTRSEIHMDILEQGELLYNGDSLNSLKVIDSNANFRIEFGILSENEFDIEIRTRRQDEYNFVGLRVDTSTNSVVLFEKINDSVTTSVTIEHEFDVTDNKQYRVELWSFDDQFFALINGFQLLELTSNTIPATIDSFSIQVYELNNLFPKISLCQVNELYSQPEEMLNDNDMFVLFRNLIADQVNNADLSDFQEFKRVYNLYKNSKDEFRSNENWWHLGYPLREPPTEGWFN